MTLKTKRVTITEPGRDQGKVFVLTEHPALKVERWARHAFLALARGGVAIPDEVKAAGIAGFASIGFQLLAGVRSEEADPLMDEMLEGIKVAPDPNHPEVERPIITSDIEEVATIWQLRAEVFTLHTGFSFADYLSKSTAVGSGTSAPATLPST